MKPDSSSLNEADRIFQNVIILKPRKYLRHYQYVIRREYLPSIKVTILNKKLARLRCKHFEKIVEMNEELRSVISSRQIDGEFEADSTSITEQDKLFKDIIVLKPMKYVRHYQYVIKREHLPAVKVTILNKEIARLRCNGYEKIVRMTEV